MKKTKNEIIQLEIESIGFNGISIAKKDGLVYFVKGTVPGDVVKAQIRRKKKRYFEAEPTEIIFPSKDRVKPECSYFGICGGCSWQHLDYQEQLNWKKQHVIDTFQRIAKVDVDEYNDTLPSPKIYNYRNKMEFSFGASRWLTGEEIESADDNIKKDFALGLHIPGRFDKILDIEECHIQNDMGNDILNMIRDKALELTVSAYHARKQSGFLRNLIIRSSASTAEMMIILVTNDITNDNENEFIDWYSDEFHKILPENFTVLHTINNTKNPVPKEQPTLIKGNGYITDDILGIKFKISPYSFFQTNSFQLDRFISLIIDSADPGIDNVIWDLYCGTGSISLPLSGKCAKIFGIELFENSVNDARQNAALNDIENVQFICADLHEKDIYNKLNELEKPDIAVIDPPRAGIHKNLLHILPEFGINKIVYVSCNPATQARDCEFLNQYYDIKSVTPVDMFPHTFHVESVAVLEKKKQ
jgi:23S rRNA (uracil1939-C5)-methyltransferase